MRRKSKEVEGACCYNILVKNNIIWHNGGTGNYNSYLGFNPETGTAVVVLSNLVPNYRVPATVLGVKLLLELDNEK